MSKASQDKLNDLHGILAEEFRKRITSGEATAADLAQARQFLKDNNIEASALPGSPLKNLVGALPFAGEDHEAPPSYQ